GCNCIVFLEFFPRLANLEVMMESRVLIRRITGRRRPLRRPFRPSLERLEDRTVPSVWTTFGHDPQHQGLSTTAAQPIDTIHWQAPVDLAPTGAAVHYGSPVITPADTVIIPVKTGSNGGFEVTARTAATGNLLWTNTTDYILPNFS